MKVSSRAEYGFRALLDLAARHGRGMAHSGGIADRQGIPEPYLKRLLAVLRRAGIVISKRGPSGGHALARPPAEITLREAFEALEGGIAPWWCAGGEAPQCDYASECGVRPVWRAIEAAARGALDMLTLADLGAGTEQAADSSARAKARTRKGDRRRIRNV